MYNKMEIFKHQRSLFELENIDKRLINVNTVATHALPAETSKAQQFEQLVEQAIDSGIQISDLETNTNDLNNKKNAQQKKAGVFVE